MSKTIALFILVAASGCYVRGHAEVAPPPPPSLEVQASTHWQGGGSEPADTAASGSVTVVLPPPIDFGWCAPAAPCTPPQP